MNEIRKQYKILAKKWHPDVNKAPHAEKTFQEITQAYDMLKQQGKADLGGSGANSQKHTWRPPPGKNPWAHRDFKSHQEEDDEREERWRNNPFLRGLFRLANNGYVNALVCATALAIAIGYRFVVQTRMEVLADLRVSHQEEKFDRLSLMSPQLLSADERRQRRLAEGQRNSSALITLITL
jgi:hypothetical protein